jgi:hypothetical protein
MTAARRWARTLYVILAGLILLGILAEALIIGPSLFGVTSSGLRAHLDVGALLLLVTLLLPVTALLARLSTRIVIASALLLLLALLQVTSGGLGMRPYGIAVLAAIHPANAALMAALAALLLVFGQRERGDRKVEPGA